MIVIAAFLMAFIVSLLFVPYRQGAVGPLIIFFVLLFMAAVSSQFWIPSFGPIWGDVAWLPMLLTVLLLAYLFSIPFRIKKKKKARSGEEEGSSMAMSVFTWVLFLLLVIAIAGGVYRGVF